MRLGNVNDKQFTPEQAALVEIKCMKADAWHEEEIERMKADAWHEEEIEQI